MNAHCLIMLCASCMHERTQVSALRLDERPVMICISSWNVIMFQLGFTHFPIRHHLFLSLVWKISSSVLNAAFPCFTTICSACSNSLEQFLLN